MTSRILGAPRTNAVAERFIGTLRREGLDHIMITGPHHLDVVLREYEQHFDAHRSHRSALTPTEDRLTPDTVLGRIGDPSDACGRGGRSFVARWGRAAL